MNYNFTCLPTDDNPDSTCENLNISSPSYTKSTPIEFLSNERYLTGFFVIEPAYIIFDS
jgi:hypothetical protein